MGGQEIQLHGLPPVHGGAANHPDDPGALSNAQEAVAAQTHGRGRARQSRLDAEIPCQSGDGPQGHGSQRRAALLESSHADLLLLAHELRKLVRFFQALSQQPMPYIPEQVPAHDQGNRHGARLFTSKAAPCLKCHATGDPTHDKFATAPNFLLARDRLKPDWAERWMLIRKISPGTAMPSGLFKPVTDHYVFAGPTPPSSRATTATTASCWCATSSSSRRKSSGGSRPRWDTARAAMQLAAPRKQAMSAKAASAGGGSQ